MKVKNFDWPCGVISRTKKLKLGFLWLLYFFYFVTLRLILSEILIFKGVSRCLETSVMELFPTLVNNFQLITNVESLIFWVCTDYWVTLAMHLSYSLHIVFQWKFMHVSYNFWWWNFPRKESFYFPTSIDLGMYNVNLQIHVMPAINFNCISNNVKGLKLTKKWIKLFEYIKSKLAPSAVRFARKNSCNQGNRKKMERWIEWANIFLHGKSNSCGAFKYFLAVNQ